MKRKSHQFHCQACGSACDIYKKGKAHRVLVCPSCGVLATNPTVLGKVAKGLLRSVPIVGDVAAEFIGNGDGKAKNTKPKADKVITDSLDKPNRGERIINRELYGV